MVPTRAPDFSRNRNRNRWNNFQEPKPEPHLSLLRCSKHREKALSPEEPCKPKTGTAQTVPHPKRNRTEQPRGHPATRKFQSRKASTYLFYCQPFSQKFWKGLADRGGWRHEVLPMPRDQLFSASFFLWTHLWRTVLHVWGVCQSPTPSRQPLFETSDFRTKPKCPGFPDKNSRAFLAKLICSLHRFRGSEWAVSHHPTRPSPESSRGQKINANFFCTKFFDDPSGRGRPRQKSWTSAPKSAFSCGPGGGEKPLYLWASGRKGQECPWEIQTEKFMFMLFFLSGSKLKLISVCSFYFWAPALMILRRLFFCCLLLVLLWRCNTGWCLLRNIRCAAHLRRADTQTLFERRLCLPAFWVATQTAC